MTLLRRALVVEALLLALLAVPLLMAPRPVLRLVGQETLGDVVYVRLFAAAGIALALVHVLILRKLEDLWWWCWVFVIFEGLGAMIALGHAAVGVPDGSATWPWWVLGLTSALFAALYLLGLAESGQEKPFA